jgi:hypothetical protein
MPIFFRFAETILLYKFKACQLINVICISKIERKNSFLPTPLHIKLPEIEFAFSESSEELKLF